MTKASLLLSRVAAVSGYMLVGKPGTDVSFQLHTDRYLMDKMSTMIRPDVLFNTLELVLYFTQVHIEFAFDKFEAI